jgi:hypothetical protein
MAAAFGRRRHWEAKARIRAVRDLERVGNKLHRGRVGDYLEFVPGSTSPQVLSDLAARVNWYLGDRTIPIYMEGAAGFPVRAEDAPYMDPALVRDPGWEERRPKGKPELVIHDVGVSSLMRFATSRRRATLASAWFADRAEWGWFELQRRFGTTKAPTETESAERVLSGVESGRSAFVLGTGPSAKRVEPDAVTADVRVTCNSVVRNDDLVRRLSPDVICFADPVFHCGPNRYAAKFREDLLRALAVTEAVPVSGHHWINPVLTHYPEIAERIAVVRLKDYSPWHWPKPDDFSVRTTGNVLTLLMLPMALALADQVEVAGCDGRQPQENYFWKHNPATQYSDEMMQSVFAAHPAFFRDRDYQDHYEEHCGDVENLARAAEDAGKTVASVTPSFIPALAGRSRDVVNSDAT